MLLKRFTTAIRHQHWGTMLIELVVVVLGIFIGLQADDWNRQRQERAATAAYLDRLRVEITENRDASQQRVDSHQRVAKTLRAVYQLLSGDAGAWPEQRELQFTFCRWYVLPISRATYVVFDELRSTGGLSLIRDTELRAAIHHAYATHEITQHQMELLQDSVRQLAVELSPWIHWRLLPEGSAEVGRSSPGESDIQCSMNFEGMAADPAAISRLAQLYRSQTNFASFRQMEVDADQAALNLLGGVAR
jgi:hypothetical protein